MRDVEQEIKKVISTQLSISVNDLENHKSFTKDLGADSLDTVSLLIAIEEHFNIQISDEDASKIKTVQDAIDYSTRLTGK